MNARPRIGVTGSARRGRAMWWCNALAVRLAGGVPVRLVPGEAASCRNLDGLVIGGGDDIGAELWRGHLVPDVRIDPERDRMELALLEQAERRDLPVLGICRGAQMLNVFRGGSLHADIHAVFERASRRRTALPLRRVSLTPGSRLSAILGADRTRVNSLHHQAVDRPGEGLTPVARDRAGIVQAVEAAGDRLLIGVQWHPEFLVYHGRQHGLFRAVVKAAA
jgi:putative glutamine amidotransferase